MTVTHTRAAKYPIRVVSKLTGVGIDTLRAWERRYAAVTPTRDDRGRLYSESDVARLRLLHQAVNAGHAIGRIANLSDRDLQRLASASGSPAATLPARPMHTHLSAALARFDSGGVERELARMAALLPPYDLVQQVLLPTLREVGSEWNRSPGGMAREHLFSAAMRHMLGSFLRLDARPEAPVRLLFATPSSDRHEIGILGCAMLAASRGVGVSYLGADLPAEQILDALRAAGDVSVLVLGVTLPSRIVARELRTMVRDVPAGVELWVGGAGSEHYSALLGARGLVLRDFDAFLTELTRVGGRAA